MLKQRPLRIFIPSFSFSSSGDSKRSSRASRQASRRSSVRTVPVRDLSVHEGPPVPAVPFKPAASLEIVAGVEEPLFNDDFILRPEEPERLPAPPSAALAARWSEFLQGLSSPVSPDEDPADDSDREPASSGSDYHLEADDEPSFPDLGDYFEIVVATPTVLTSPGKPKVIDISPSASARNSLCARSSSYDFSSSHYSDGSTVSASPPGTPLSSAYDSDHSGGNMPGSFPNEDPGAVKQPAQPSKRHCRDLTGSFIPTLDNEDKDDVCADDNLSVYEDHITAVRQTVHRPLSTDITRVWFKA